MGQRGARPAREAKYIRWDGRACSGKLELEVLQIFEELALSAKLRTGLLGPTLPSFGLGLAGRLGSR